MAAASAAWPPRPCLNEATKALSDTTTKLIPAGVAAPVGAVGAGNEAVGRERLIQQVELLLRESGHTDPFDGA